MMRSGENHRIHGSSVVLMLGVTLKSVVDSHGRGRSCTEAMVTVQ